MTHFFTAFSQRLTHTWWFLFVCFAMVGVTMQAQNAKLPSVNPKMSFTNAEGQTVQEDNFNGGAPLHVVFEANPQDLGNYTPLYEWQFLRENSTTPFLTRYERTTHYDFSESGNFNSPMPSPPMAMASTTSSKPKMDFKASSVFVPLW